MSELRYSELKYNGETITEQWKIDEILIKNKFSWMVNAEIKNARLEIFNDTLVWNAGIWYFGNWYFGVWRDGEWRSGTWQNGVWYNGTWQNGTFKSGLIFKGIFFKGKIEGGEIRGGNFINVEISPNVKEYTGDEYQEIKQKEQEQATNVAVAQPETNPERVRVHGTKPAAQQIIETQPKIQQEKMKYLKTFEKFTNESFHKDDIYTLIEFIEEKSEKLENESDDFSGSYINYDIINDQTININLGWNSPEEFMKLEAEINFDQNSNKITLKGVQEGSSVYSDENYKNNYNESFDTVEELIKFLDSEI